VSKPEPMQTGPVMRWWNSYARKELPIFKESLRISPLDVPDEQMGPIMPQKCCVDAPYLFLSQRRKQQRQFRFPRMTRVSKDQCHPQRGT
jgi:hypothetical protein